MLCFNPIYRLRKAESNIYCYSLDPVEGTVKNGSVLHPLNAILLCLFNGRREKSEISQLLSRVTGVVPAQAHRFVSDLIGQYGSLLVEGEVNDRYNPLDFLMPEKMVDLSRLRLPAPISLGLLLTYKCSSDCVYCYANRRSPEDKQEMGLELARDIVRQAAGCGVEVIYMSGGDPFVKKWVKDLIAYIHSHKINLSLSTKEFLSPATCSGLAAAGVKRLQVSIDTLNAETADMLVGRKGFLKDALSTIDNLETAGIAPTTKSVITKYNYRDLPKLVEWLVSRGIKGIILGRYFRTIYNHKDDLFVDDGDITWLNRKLSQITIPGDVIISWPQVEENKGAANDADKLEDFLNRGFCPVGRTSLVISPSGKVIPCEQLPSRPPYVLGDLKKNTLLEIWNSEELRSLMFPDRGHFKGTQCYECGDFETCAHKKGWCMMEIFKACKTTFGVHPGCPLRKHDVRLF